jgi:proteic killer suppression protein
MGQRPSPRETSGTMRRRDLRRTVAQRRRSVAGNNALRYALPCMIRSFRDRDAQRLAERERVKKWSPALQKAALRKLRVLDAATELGDLRVPPGNRLERPKGDRAGQYSIRINDQWRICFRWSGGDAHDVEIVDYH